MENWIDVKGYEGIYQVSDKGRIKRLVGFRCKEERVLKLGKNKGGYHIVFLSKNNKRKHYLVHRLVAMSFIENPENKPQVNHIDGCKTNNCLSNLEWNTSSENMQHSYDTGLQASLKGSNNGNSKLTEKDIPEIFKLREEGLSQRKIAANFGVVPALICKILKRETWYHVQIN